jgi:pilus assembly protein Flp/PilA
VEPTRQYLQNCKVIDIDQKASFAIIIKKYLEKNLMKGDAAMLFAPKEKGQGLVEYALILVLVAVVVIVILALLGPAIGNVFSNIIENI